MKTFFFYLLIFYLCVCVYVYERESAACVNVCYMYTDYRCQEKLEENRYSPITVVKGSCELPDEYWEPNLGPQEASKCHLSSPCSF